MVIRRQKVSMRKLDHNLNASDLLSCAQISKYGRRQYLDILQKAGIGVRESKAYWIPFNDGVYLSHAIGLFDTLRPLLLWPGHDLALLKDNYFLREKVRKTARLPAGFANLACGEHNIVYNLQERMVNARHIFHLSNERPTVFRKFLAGCATDCVTLGGHQKAQGTYIPFALACQLCKHLAVSYQPLQDLLAETAIGEEHAREDAELCQTRVSDLEHADPRDPQPTSADKIEGYFWSPSFQDYLGLASALSASKSHIG